MNNLEGEFPTIPFGEKREEVITLLDRTKESYETRMLTKSVYYDILDLLNTRYKEFQETLRNSSTEGGPLTKLPEGEIKRREKTKTGMMYFVGETGAIFLNENDHSMRIKNIEQIPELKQEIYELIK